MMRQMSAFFKHKNTRNALFCLAVLLVAFFTYFRNHQYPPNLFWDENYHIASAEKYRYGVFFMEPHPPLGKLFIALGEQLIAPNRGVNTNAFLATDYIQDIPQGYSFAGVRFFPALFAPLSACLFYIILLRASEKPFLSFLFTSLYLFENALIVHSRGAMLEPVQLFFILLLILGFVTGVRNKSITLWSYLVFGFLYGAAMAVKLNSITLGFLFIAAMFFEKYRMRRSNAGTGVFMKGVLWFAGRALLFGGAAFAVFAGTYYVHIALAKRAVDGRYYEASGQYKKIMEQGKTGAISNFPTLFAEHIRFISHYEKGVPRYDACKPGENGSLPVAWPFGNKSINYRWESRDGFVRYLYLQGNPVIWLAGILGVLLAANLLGSYFMFRHQVKDRARLFLVSVFFALYVLYMGSVMSLERVMYLYHYFIPLIYSMILFFLLALYLFDERLKRKDRRVYSGILVLIGIVISVYLFFSPLTYYLPLSTAQFELRDWFGFWGMEAVR